jgi:hypothetical protein
MRKDLLEARTGPEGGRIMANSEDRPTPSADRPQPRGIFTGSDADLQEQERAWESEESDGESEEPQHLGIETPEADALEQARSLGSEEDLDWHG